MTAVVEVFWRQVTSADFYNVERAPGKGPKSGGGQVYFSVDFGPQLSYEGLGSFLGFERPKDFGTEKPVVSIEAAVLDDPALVAPLEFRPRYRTKPDDRYYIARQNRQRTAYSRHPAWDPKRGFPAAPDDIEIKDDPRMPDLSRLKLVIARDDEGAYFADFVNTELAPPDAPAQLGVLFRENRRVPPDGLIVLDDPVSVEELRQLIDAGRFAPGGPGARAPEVEDAREAVSRTASPRRRSGQGFRQSTADRIAIDRYAMGRAAEHMQAAGWEVEDVSANHPYDYRCTRSDEILHLEVKGTTGDGSAVLLTPNEVAHAREEYPHVALLTVRDVVLSQDEEGEPVAGAGEVELVLPWEIDAQGELIPTGYSYVRTATR